MFEKIPAGQNAARSKRGFTLIELLVVIAIISILAALLFPVFAKAQDQARQTTCLSHQKQIATALTLYAQDYDEAIVPALQYTGAPKDALRSDYQTWVDLLQPSLKNGAVNRARAAQPSGVMNCPSYSEAQMIRAADDFYEAPGFWAPYFPAAQYHAHYGIGNGDQWSPEYGNIPYWNFPGGYALRDGQVKTTYLAQVLRVAETAIVTDGFTGVAAVSSGNSPLVMMGGIGGQVHSGGTNVVFLDGHAKWLQGNSERYVEQGPDGVWFEKYYTVDR